MTWLSVDDGCTLLDSPVDIRNRNALNRPLPAPLAGDGPRPTVWVVQQISGGRLRVLAEWHSTAPLPEGGELRFYNRAGDDQLRVATVRAGSWHWCVAESALEPEVKS